MSTNFSLKGKTALITGATRGIGRAIALGYAESGADIFIVSRKLPELEKVAEEIRALGRRCEPIEANVGRMEDIEKISNRVRELGGVDILVNNAGGSPGVTTMMDLQLSFWDTVLNLNLRGPVFLSKVIAKNIKERGGGSIINVASIGAFRVDLECPPYSIAKAGLIMATKAMAIEWAPYNIRVNAIAPGNVHTRLGDSRFKVVPDLEERTIARTPQKRFAQPDEIAGAAIYLASSEASFVTGATLLLDGGILLT